jgi:hypothetical protein
MADILRLAAMHGGHLAFSRHAWRLYYFLLPRLTKLAFGFLNLKNAKKPINAAPITMAIP